MSSSTIEIPPLPTITNARSPVRQLSVFLHNQVGALLSLVKLLNENSIEVLGLSVQDSAELTLVRLIVTDPDTAKDVFDKEGLSCVSKVVIVVELHEGANDLCKVLAALLAAEINIHHSYSLMTHPGQKAHLALYVDDPEVGSEALNHGGFTLLTQGDLSR